MRIRIVGTRVIDGKRYIKIRKENIVERIFFFFMGILRRSGAN